MGSVAMILTSGGQLVAGGGDGRTLIVTGTETVVPPPLSVAWAVNTIFVPKGALLQISPQ